MLLNGIRTALQCTNPRCECHRERGNVHCPAHDDRTPSLAPSERDGKTLWHCFSGCSQEAVAAALRERGLLSGPIDAEQDGEDA